MVAIMIDNIMNMLSTMPVEKLNHKFKWIS
jgi:hypothetical protein